MEKLHKFLPVVTLKTKKLLVSVDAVVCLKFFATTIVDKHMANLLLHCVQGFMSAVLLIS